MGVVDLDDVLLMEVAQGAVFRPVLAHDGLNGSGHKEILLLQPQGLALIVVVLGVEDLGNGLGHGLLLHGLQVLAGGKQGHVHRGGALGVPKAQGVGVLGAVAGNHHILGDGQHGGIPGVLNPVGAVLVPHVLNLAPEADLFHLVQLGNQPGIPLAQPVVGKLHLLAVHDLLLENAQLVADGVAGGGNGQGGHGVQVAGGQTAQAAVAQPRVGLGLKQIGGGEAQALDSLPQRLHNAQVIRVFQHGTAH